MDADFADTEIQSNRIKVGRRGEVSMQMAASDLISLAVNVAQNGWPLDDLGFGSAENAAVLQKMLGEVYEQILEANRLATAKRTTRERR